MSSATGFWARWVRRWRRATTRRCRSIPSSGFPPSGRHRAMTVPASMGYYSDDGFSSHPRLCRLDSLPHGGRHAPWGPDAFLRGHPRRRDFPAVEMAGSPKFVYGPSGPLAHAPSSPEKTGRACLVATSSGQPFAHLRPPSGLALVIGSLKVLIVRLPVALRPANDLPVGRPLPTMRRSPVKRTERSSPISEYAAQTCPMLGG